jgi:hypothetical protein
VAATALDPRRMLSVYSLAQRSVGRILNAYSRAEPGGTTDRRLVRNANGTRSVPTTITAHGVCLLHWHPTRFKEEPK